MPQVAVQVDQPPQLFMAQWTRTFCEEALLPAQLAPPQDADGLLHAR